MEDIQNKHMHSEDGHNHEHDHVMHHPQANEPIVNPPKISEPLNKNVLLICATVVVVCLIVSGAFLYGKSNTPSNVGNNNDGNNGNPDQVNIQPPDISKVNISSNPFVGNTNAPVVVAFWSDYQCPFCKRAEQDAMTQIYNEYVKTGKAKIVYKDYAFLGPDSITASLASRAVWEVAPDKFYEWNKAMFVKQDDENGGWGNKADILVLTKSLGIDSTKVGQLMTSKVQEYQKAMDADKAEGTSFGITGTPGTIIGTKRIVGADVYSAFKAAIEEVLNALN